MTDSPIDDSRELRGVTADGTPLGVQARFSLSFDETLSEDVAAGAEAWQRVLQAVQSGKARAEITVHLDDEADAAVSSSFDDGDENEGDTQAISRLRFTGVPVTIGNNVGEGEITSTSVGGSAAPTKASLAGATIAEQRRKDEADKKRAQEQDTADDVYDVPRRAVIAMRSKTGDAAKRFRSAIVSLDAVPGNQVEGISPLYHVMGVDDSSDASAAVIQMTTKLKPQAIAALLDSLSASHEGAVTLRLIDVEGERMSAEAAAQDAAADVAYAIELPLVEAKKQAEILAPWLDMDPDARLDGDPVSFLLAMAPDAARVGKVDDRWILGETQ
ncbi:hypothetical protein OZX73_06550 [Bifidobacterium sp. ESL0775]|uniref:hypothetical protein n=1 Tax=Bifidobacterium sp. ESL0775 TaxID=2983230 RepID=UPI0023F9958D|nr:hypothetical protein [Bifidobacterium sp. ESL0775]WEV68932.1 hypothetical protein OZX73_06550 [Bifidobacterium sp. ESL0775]